jgi:hypothetical protein
MREYLKGTNHFLSVEENSAEKAQRTAGHVAFMKDSTSIGKAVSFHQRIVMDIFL